MFHARIWHKASAFSCGCRSVYSSVWYTGISFTTAWRMRFVAFLVFPFDYLGPCFWTDAALVVLESKHVWYSLVQPAGGCHRRIHSGELTECQVAEWFTCLTSTEFDQDMCNPRSWSWFRAQLTAFMADGGVSSDCEIVDNNVEYDSMTVPRLFLLIHRQGSAGEGWDSLRQVYRWHDTPHTTRSLLG